MLQILEECWEDTNLTVCLHERKLAGFKFEIKYHDVSICKKIFYFIISTRKELKSENIDIKYLIIFIIFFTAQAAFTDLIFAWVQVCLFMLNCTRINKQDPGRHCLDLVKQASSISPELMSWFSCTCTYSSSTLLNLHFSIVSVYSSEGHNSGGLLAEHCWQYSWKKS